MGSGSSKLTRTLSANEKTTTRGIMRKSTRHRRAKSEMGVATQINSSTVIGRIMSTGIPNENSEDRPHDADLPDTPITIPYTTHGEQVKSIISSFLPQTVLIVNIIISVLEVWLN